MATAKLGDVDALGSLSDNLFGILGAFHYKGVRHANDGKVLIGLPTTGATPGAALLARAQHVPHVVGEHAIFDEYVASGGMTLVIDGGKAPFTGHRTIVDQGDQGARHELSDLAGIDR